MKQRNDGFRHYEYRKGDTREAIWEGVKFLGSALWQSKTTRIAVLVVLGGIIGEVSGVNQKVRDAAATVLIGDSIELYPQPETVE